MPPLFLIDIIALGISLVVATSLALVTLGSDWRRTINRLFALFTLLEAAWATCSLLLRLALWFEVGNPLLMSELTTFAFTLMGPVLLVFSVRYVNRRTRAADLVAILGLIVMGLLAIPLFSHQLVFNPRLDTNGSTTMELGSLGFVLAPLPALYFAWSLILFWQERERIGEPYLPLSILTLVIGFVLGGVLNLPFPLLSITNTISVAILGYGIVSRQLFNPLRELTADLERRVEERTTELEDTATQLREVNETLSRRGMQLEAITRIVQEMAAIRDVELLVQEAVRLISNRFGFYHVGLFLLDDAGEHAVLRAVSSVEGRERLLQGYQVAVKESGIASHPVGYAIDRGEPAIGIAADATPYAAVGGDDDVRLPDTRSRVTLPLGAQDEILGALDIQVSEPQAFHDDDVALLQTLADQVAMTINNIQLLQQVQESLDAERRAYGELGRRSWLEFLRSSPDLGFVKEEGGDILPAGDLWRPAVERAMRTGQPTLEGDEERVLLAPVKLHNQVIGVIDAHKSPEDGEWTPEQVELLESLADQLSIALDNARLHQDAQRRAARERLVSQISSRVRGTLDMDTVLRVAAQEMREQLGLPEVVIKLTGSLQDDGGEEGI